MVRARFKLSTSRRVALTLHKSNSKVACRPTSVHMWYLGCISPK